MKAAVLARVGGQFEVRDVKIDAPDGREVLIAVKASGLCHSDDHIRTHDFGFPMPLVLGHELAGVVQAVGHDVTGLRPGDHVTACPVLYCGRCVECRMGAPIRCRNKGFTVRGPEAEPRLRADDDVPIEQFEGLGAFAQQVLIHENQVVKINEEIPFDRACLLGCGVATGVGSVLHAAKVQPGESVAVIGCGGVGLNGVQGARIAGAHKIIAIDVQPEKLELATKFGATDVINSHEEDVVERVLEITGGRGVQHAFEMIGLLPTLELAVKVLGLGGTAYVVGMQQPESRLSLDLFADILMQQKGVRGVDMGSTNPQVDIPFYADLYVQGRLNLDDLVSRRIQLDEINEGYEELAGGKIARTVITFD
ncbi:Zn-dependent alcohol dehydrogenase [Streptomyces carpinensis]|uniref:Zn-dependent alcohol dehydrogenase n=1 Tax=Streptomyces carpinensis TaxID=66369 RepID=A0ABV1VV52_9ACTN|nr:Zn-dependent alcohol dehydrogenase [Streptomyces carpinensis]